MLKLLIKLWKKGNRKIVLFNTNILKLQLKQIALSLLKKTNESSMYANQT